MKNPEPIPAELSDAFEDDPEFKSAFNALTPGRQRGYTISFSQPKQSQTRAQRIEKYKDRIFNGLGLNVGKVAAFAD
ncbi:MAG: YdeI/OmpD-associated family protein [Bacteroidales bacterium]|nr:YdeI/OmpD-associated family protein [Bacteroidales bacterium]MDD3664043.1 YdeI/OmpD-associated family protein [Bacteroidales bacterium]